MTVLNYQENSNVIDYQDMIDKFRTFAIAQGWTSSEYQQDVVWANQGGGVYGWDAGGGELYLNLTSTGFGSQSLQYRFRVYDNPGEALDGIVYCAGHKGVTTYDTSSTHPAAKTATLWSIASRNLFSFPRSTIDSVWFFGNSKFLMIVAKTDIDYVKYLIIGTPEIYDTSETEGDLHLWQSTTYSATHYWFNKNMGCPLDLATSNNLYYDGARKNTNAGVNYVMTSAGGFTASKIVAGYGRCIQRNAYAEARPIFKQTFYVQHDSDSRYRALGPMWVYRMDVEDLIIGQHLLYGPTEEYIVFPLGRLSWTKGIAVRIN